MVDLSILKQELNATKDSLSHAQSKDIAKLRRQEQTEIRQLGKKYSRLSQELKDQYMGKGAEAEENYARRGSWEIFQRLTADYLALQGKSELIDKVSPKHIRIYELECQVGDGIFVVSKKEVKTINMTEKENTIIKPWFKNSDINRWNTLLIEFEQIIYSNYNTVDNIENFPNIEKHLNKFKRIISRYAYRWHDLHRSRGTEIFLSPKIVAPQRSYRNTFGYNEISWYATSDVFFITQKDKTISLKYILTLVNSRLYYLWLYNRGKRKGETLELIAKPLSEIPIKKISKDEQKPFINLVDKILAITKDDNYLRNEAKQKKVADYEHQIDKMVYKFYNLMPEEIKTVENFDKK